ncbi:unnamed protein product [Clavelina lepadiformis]|uniref:Uncharacterized protein n=1 Tax=Clavelina lepadiformis TaxID=159417 RepID=A0ABP0FWN9_CLALP
MKPLKVLPRTTFTLKRVEFREDILKHDVDNGAVEHKKTTDPSDPEEEEDGERKRCISLEVRDPFKQRQKVAT